MTAELRAASLETGEVAALLRELGQRIELSGDSPFKARAYFRAAESLLALTEPLPKLIAANRLRDIPGVGAAIAEKIEALHLNGTHRTLERLRADVPPSALEILAIPGLPVQKARLLVKDLGLHSVEALEDAALRGVLAETRGIGPALQAKILKGIEIRRRSSGQRWLHHAAELIEVSAANLGRSHPQLARIVPAGEFRRGCELVSDLRIVAELADQTPAITELPLSSEITLSVADRNRYGVALVLATGSRSHVEMLQARAAGKGLSLDQHGLHRGRKLISCPDETDVYRELGLSFIPPELREGADEIERAAAGIVSDLVEQADLHGVLHAHTTRSDGANSLQEMAEATRQRGYSYFGVADHSQSAGYAGGLSVDSIEAQHTEADALNRAYRGHFRLLKGIESDILADGSLDYPDEILARFDFVVASIHSQFRLGKKAQTERMLRAVANPYTTILGHITGRLLLRRDGYELDIEQVLQACAEHGVAVEINANPNRLDLDWEWHRTALRLGCTLSINPDAHSIAEIDLMRWGIMVARKGGVPRDRVLNALDLRAMTDYLQQRRKRMPAVGG